VSAVPANDVKLIYFHLFDSSDHFLCFEPTTARAKYSSAKVMYVFNDLRVKFDPVLGEIFVETSVAPFNSPYLFHLIVVP
jgi:hypothetical protein